MITQAENDNSDSSDEDDLNIELDQPDLGKTFQFAKQQKLDIKAESDKKTNRTRPNQIQLNLLTSQVKNFFEKKRILFKKRNLKNRKIGKKCLKQKK